MKKCNKPEMNVEKYLINSTIADSSVSDSVGGGNTYGSNQTENVGFNSWIGLFD